MFIGKYSLDMKKKFQICKRYWEFDSSFHFCVSCHLLLSCFLSARRDPQEYEHDMFNNWNWTVVMQCLNDVSFPQAIFEVISSEHSYLHSLEILVRLFKNSNELSEIINKTDHHHLFSNIVDVCEASKK